MSDLPLISVIIPVYNVEEYLERCIESVLNQDYTNLEIFLVDDGSTDNSGSICDSFEKKDNRIKVIHQKNAGQSAARNTALKVSTGEYIAFIDSDDYWDLDCLSFLYNLLKENNAQLSVCAVRHIGFPGQKDKEIENDDVRVFNGKETAANFLMSKNGFTAAAHHALINGEICRRHLFEEGVIYEDLEYMVRLSFDLNVAVSSRKRKYNYFYRSNNSSSAATLKRIENLNTVISKLRQLINEKAPDMQILVDKRYIFNAIGHLQTLHHGEKKLFSSIRKSILEYNVTGEMPSRSCYLLYKSLKFGKLAFIFTNFLYNTYGKIKCLIK